MDHHDRFEADSKDEPLFVLKYRRSIRLSLILSFGFFIWFFWFCITVPAKTYMVQLLGKPVVGFASLIFLFQLIELVLFKEIRLYRDRIVQAWNLMGSREIKLANARLEGRSIGSLRGKLFFDQERTRFQRVLHGLFPIRIISYAEHYADPKDAEELTRHLANLSGRKVEEFNAARITMATLIKEKSIDV